MYQAQQVGDAHNNNILEHHDHQSKMWTSLPGIIQSINMSHMTCTVQPSVMVKVYGEDGTPTDTKLPLLVDCPVQFPYGGSTNITFPVAAGDECLVVFSSRNIDSWWQSGGIQTQGIDVRMHDLSDGFVMLGFRSIPRMIPNINTTDIQIRNDAGDTFIGLNPTSQVITIVTPQTINVQCKTANINCSTAANITAPDTTINSSTHINGNTNIQGDLSVSGNTSVGGSESIGGDLNVAGHTNI